MGFGHKVSLISLEGSLICVCMYVCMLFHMCVGRRRGPGGGWGRKGKKDLRCPNWLERRVRRQERKATALVLWWTGVKMCNSCLWLCPCLNILSYTLTVLPGHGCGLTQLACMRDLITQPVIKKFVRHVLSISWTALLVCVSNAWIGLEWLCKYLRCVGSTYGTCTCWDMIWNHGFSAYSFDNCDRNELQIRSIFFLTSSFTFVLNLSIASSQNVGGKFPLKLSQTLGFKCLNDATMMLGYLKEFG